MEIFEAISTVRKNKNIKVAEVISNAMSRASYNRFVNGETDLYSQHLIEVIDNLHITLEELQLICNEYEDGLERQLLKQIKTAFEQQNLNELKFLSTYCDNHYASEKKVLYKHLSALIDILTARLLHKKINIEDNELYKYLVKTETWTRYELIMFNNSLFYFNIHAVTSVLPKAIKKLNYYEAMNPYANEGFRMIINAIIFFIKESEYRQAIRYIHILEKHNLNEDQTYEQLLLRLLKGIKLLLIRDRHAEEELEKCLSIMSFLNMNKMKLMAEGLIKHIKENSLYSI